MSLSSAETQTRIEALRKYQIFDTLPEQVFDDITRLTSFICETPIAIITLLDSERQWFKSRVGVEAMETPIEFAFCAHAIREEKLLLVPDATKDGRFASNPLVTGEMNIRFYAGAPLHTSDGVALGTLCAIDSRPRELSLAQCEALSALARQVMMALELRLTIKTLDQALAEKQAAQSEIRQLRHLLPMCAWCRKIRDDDNLWTGVEEYLSVHSDTRFSHGICPDCSADFSTQGTAAALP